MSIRAAGSAIGQVIAWFVAGLVVLVLAATVVIPKIAGGTTYTILTGSMRPGMPPGTMVVDRPVKADDVRIGDVITFQLKSGEPTVATHRVVGVNIAMDGTRSFTTRGDANNAADTDPVLPVQIKGKRWYAIPFLGLPSLWLGVGTREVIVMAAVVILLGYALISFIGAARDRRRSRRTAATPENDESKDDSNHVEPEFVEAAR